MQHFWKTVWRGFAIVVPFLFSLYVAYWILSGMEHLLGGFFRVVLPVYFPGMGILGSIFLLYLVGRYMDTGHAGSQVVQFGGRIMQKVPLVKTFYVGARDMARSFTMAGQREERARQVVLVTLADGMRLMGLVTAESIPDLGNGAQKNVAVYIPMSYQLGGFTVFLPRESLTPVDLTVKQAMEIVLSGAMAGWGDK